MKEIRHGDHVHTIRDRHDFTGTGNRHCGGEDPDCPHPASEEQTEFERQPMVDWLNPRQLAATGIKTVTASTFGGYADKREMEAVLTVADDDPGNPFDVDGDYSKRNELWFDYVADLGDGFDATYTMARLLARNLTIGEKDYPQGRFVVLGGDQVYPTASREEYQNRFLGPYRAAYPWAPGSEPRHLYALPGNHDWYDGLTSFIRIFCQSKGKPGEGGRWIGGWRTQQRRSYFAIHLPHDWWIWGIDSQLASDIDRPQIEYFDQLARKMRRQMSDKEKEKLSREERLKVEAAENERGAKQKIILVTAEPNWVFSGDQAARDEGCAIDEEAFDTLSWFENRYIRRNRFQLRLVVAGDLHHYVRYEGPHTQRITSGGGGAYLLATHRMPKNIVVKEGTTQTFSADLEPVTYERKTCYPASEDSERLAAGVFGLPARNKAFAFFLACVYVLFSWAAMTSMRLTLLAGVAMVFLTAAFSDHYTRRHRALSRASGIFHGMAHVGMASAAWWGGREVAALIDAKSDLVGGTIVTFSVTVLAFVTGWLAGSLFFATYLLRMSRNNGAHTEEVFSSMAIADYKNFLRMHIDAQGELTIHAIGMKRIPHDWEFDQVERDQCGKPWFSSKKFMRFPEYCPHLIETIPKERTSKTA